MRPFTVGAALALLAGGAFAAPEVQWKLKFTEDFNGKALNPKLWQRIAPAPNPPNWQKFLSTRDDLVQLDKGVLKLLGVVNADKTSRARGRRSGSCRRRACAAGRWTAKSTCSSG